MTNQSILERGYALVSNASPSTVAEEVDTLVKQGYVLRGPLYHYDNAGFWVQELVTPSVAEDQAPSSGRDG